MMLQPGCSWAKWRTTHERSLGLVQGMNVFLQPYLDRGLLVEVLPDNPTPDRKLSLLYPHRHLSRKVRVFTEWLESLL